MHARSSASESSAVASACHWRSSSRTLKTFLPDRSFELCDPRLAGPTSAAVQHFAGLGHPTPADVNVADMVLDLVIKSPVCSYSCQTLGTSVTALPVDVHLAAMTVAIMCCDRVWRLTSA